MAKRPRTFTAGRENRLLAALPRAESDRLTGLMSEVSFATGDVVCRAGRPIHHVYFPRTGMLSLIVTTADGSAVEVGIVGPDGVAGLPAALGVGFSPHIMVCQAGPCTAWRMPVAALRAEVRRGGPLPDLLRRYAVYLLAQVSQAVACNHLHDILRRCARWLLMAHDRAGADEFPLTHEYLALLLGVQRPSVTVAAIALKEAGLIWYSRGWITVLDREGLEAAACECYRAVRDAYDRILPES